MKKQSNHRTGKQNNLLLFTALFLLCIFLELFLSNYRDFSIGDAPTVTLSAESLVRLDGGTVTEDGAFLIQNTGAELEFSELEVPVRAITVYTSAPEGTVVIASCLLSDDACRYDYRSGCRLYFNPAGGHCYTRASLSSNGNIHGLLISVDRLRHDFTIGKIVFNERRGFHFDKLRFLLFLIIALTAGACRAFRPETIVYDAANRKHRFVMYAAMAVCLLTLLWIYRALCSFGAGDAIAWPLEQPVSEYSAYVQQLDAFQKGQLHLDLEADPRLSSMQNVYDITERSRDTGIGDWKQPYWDRAYYNEHYYSYFGIGPLLAVYYPYYFLTGELPGDAFVSLIFSAASVFLLFGVLEELRKKFLPDIHLLYYAAGFLTVFFAGLIPLVMVSSCFYYIAVNAAMTFLLLFLMLYLHAFSMRQGLPRRICAVASGAAFVLIVLCRPNVALAAVGAAAPVAVFYLMEKETSWKYKLPDIACFLVPILAGGAGIMVYNYARFASPFEFGTSYQLTVSDISYNTLQFTPERLLGYLYYYVLQPLDTELVFPFFRMHTEVIDTLGNFMYHASSMGLLSLPFFLFLFLLRHRSIDYRSKVKSFTYAGILIGCILLSLLNFSLGGVFVRYLCDITLPLALLALLLVLEYECRLKGGLFSRRVILLVFGITIFISTMLIFSNENCMLLNYAPEYYLRIMDLFCL